MFRAVRKGGVFSLLEKRRRFYTLHFFVFIPQDLSSLRNEELYASAIAVPPPLPNVSLNKENSPAESDIPLNHDKEVSFP